MLGHGYKVETLYPGTESGTGTSLHTILASAQEVYPQTPAPSSYFTHKSMFFSFKMAEGQRWTREQVDALIDAYSDIRVQENVEGIATNKEVYGQVQKLMKDDHDIDRTVKQVETKLKKLRSGDSKLKDRMKSSGSERPYLTNALTSVEKVAYEFWDKLDRILGKSNCNNSRPKVSLFLAHNPINFGSIHMIIVIATYKKIFYFFLICMYRVCVRVSA